MSDPRELLRHWLPTAHEATVAVVSGGFSGAVIQRVEFPHGVYCLRGWPTGGGALPAERIRGLHAWLAWLGASGISTVAVPLAALDGSTVVARRGRHWQLEPWQPGRADFHRDPSDARLRNAGAELARLHVASERYEATPAGAPWFQSGTGTAPAVRERLEGLRRFVQRPAVRAAPGVAHGTPEQAVLAGRLSRQLPARAEWAIRELAPLADVSFRLHPCLRDVWHDHVLFRGDDVTGVIDPSAARTENVASDLSRLLGSLVGDEFARWETALDTYSSVRPLSGDERRLVRALDLSGVVLSAVHWLDCMSEAALSDREIKRAAALAERVARCGPGGERAEL